MSSERVFQVERFYFGNLIQNGEPVGKPLVVGRSPQVSAQQVQQCLKLARVKPPEVALTTPDFPSTLAIYRGGDLGYIMVKAQRTAEGIPQLLYLLIPEMAMKWLGGNYRLFETLGFQDMPSFETPRNLPPLKLEDPRPLTDEEQSNYLYDLFYYCGDQVKNVEGILAALINNIPIAIYNAPPALAVRLGFIQGLFSLLPTPARFALTWTTHTDHSTPAQVNFVPTLEGLEGYLVYDWEVGQLLDDPPPDKYSKFIASQLRLDASLVVETTTNIARTAVWRAMRKENLPQALLFAARRAAIDAAVTTSQPADRETVAAMLRQDPTLTGELRVQYAKHLLAFTLALGDELQHADVLPNVAAAERPVAEALYNQLKEVAHSPRSTLNVLNLVERWMVNIPQANVIPWQQLAYISARKHLEHLLAEGKIPAAVTFLGRVQNIHRALQMEAVVPQLLDAAWASAAKDSQLALSVFLLSAEYLGTDVLTQVISEVQFVRQLPPRLQTTLSFLQPKPKAHPPRDLFSTGVNELAAQYQLLVMGRLAEVAVYLKRDELIETRVLEALLRASQTGSTQRFARLMEYLATQYSHPNKLRELEPELLELLPQLYFSAQRYETGIQLLETYQNTVFGLSNQGGFTQVMGNIFLNSQLSLEALERIFALIEHSKIRPEPRTRAYAAVLSAVNWGSAYRNLARRLTVMLFNDDKLFEVIGLEPVLNLLRFYITEKDAPSIQEVSDILIAAALHQGAKGSELILRTYNLLKDTPELAKIATNLVRRFVRFADKDYADKLPAYFESKLGKALGKTLRATYAMRRLMAGRSMSEFADALDYTTAFLIDVGTAYHEDKDPPHRSRLREGLDSMSGGLQDRDRDMIGDNLDKIAQAVFLLGNRQQRGRQSADFEKALLRNDTMPQTGLDFLIYLGGIFANRQRAEVDLARESRTHVLGNRSALMLRDESIVIATFLRDLLAAFPPDQPPQFDQEALNDEIDSLWQGLTLYNQRQVQASLASNTQYLAQVIPYIARPAKEAAFKNPKFKTGHAAPNNAIEALLWISGYFKRTHNY